MEIVKISIPKETLQMLVDSEALKTSDFQLIGCDEDSYDYTDNPLWVAAKEKSNKAYKQLKQIEFDIRHK